MPSATLFITAVSQLSPLLTGGCPFSSRRCASISTASTRPGARPHGPQPQLDLPLPATQGAGECQARLAFGAIGEGRERRIQALAGRGRRQPLHDGRAYQVGPGTPDQALERAVDLLDAPILADQEQGLAQGVEEALG